MNQQVRELAIKAGAEPSGYKDRELSLSNFDTEKFAELIAEEMYDFIMDEIGDDNGVPGLGLIKKHLGVEG